MFGWESAATALASCSNRCQRSGSLRQDARQDLDRDVPVQPLVPRPVDLSHPARAERREDLVGAEAGAGWECHRMDAGTDDTSRYPRPCGRIGNINAPTARPSRLITLLLPAFALPRSGLSWNGAPNRNVGLRKIRQARILPSGEPPSDPLCGPRFPLFPAHSRNTCIHGYSSRTVQPPTRGVVQNPGRCAFFYFPPLLLGGEDGLSSAHGQHARLPPYCGVSQGKVVRRLEVDPELRGCPQGR